MKKTLDEVRGLIRAAIIQEKDFARLMNGAGCEIMAARSDASQQAFQQALAWLSDVEA